MAKTTEKTALTVSGILEWAHLTPGKPNEMSGKYQVDVCQLNAADVKALEAAGLEGRDGKDKGKPEKGRYITPKAGKPLTSGIVDAKCNPFDGADRIGNGTHAKVAVRPFDYTYKGKSGVGCGLQAVQILDLIEYAPAAMFGEEEGFVAEPVTVGADDDPWGDDDVPN